MGATLFSFFVAATGPEVDMKTVVLFARVTIVKVDVGTAGFMLFFVNEQVFLLFRPMFSVPRKESESSADKSNRALSGTPLLSTSFPVMFYLSGIVRYLCLRV